MSLTSNEPAVTCSVGAGAKGNGACVGRAARSPLPDAHAARPHRINPLNPATGKPGRSIPNS
ncbi:MAG TPA: hypothetical protein VGF82_19580 [Terracidiphilus sp.]